MVRRRIRPAKDGEVVKHSTDPMILNGISLTTATAIAGANLQDDQYFASPKRKDCKISNATENLATAETVDLTYDEKTKTIKTKSPSSPGKIKTERVGISGRNIGVPLATRSQTKTIENFFRANAANKSAKVNSNDHEDPNINSPSSSPPPLPHSAIIMLSNGTAIANEQLQSTDFQIQNNCDLNNDENTNDTDNTEFSNESTNLSQINGIVTIGDFQSHRSTLRDSHSSLSSNTDNIFLQEPVLTLDVDKSPNQASSIKINKSIEIGAIFSSPPASFSATGLNGRFNQIVTLQTIDLTSPNGELFKYDKTASLNGFVYDLDSSSCDSGVAFYGNSMIEIDKQDAGLSADKTQARRRKPATPHRILCPSPIKTMPRDTQFGVNGVVGMSPSARKVVTALKDQLSPRKSQRQLVVTSCKSRRRLNQSIEQPPYTPIISHNNAQPVSEAVDDDEFENDDNYDNLASCLCEEAPLPAMNTNVAAYNNNNTNKSILNSAKHLTARQNTTIINPINNQISNKTTKSGGTGAKSKLTSASSVPNATKKNPSLPLAAVTNGNRELTEFFPVRRSVRKTKTAVKEEMMRNLEKAVLEERAEGLKIATFEGKGRGIIADRRFARGEFVIEYVGDLISMTQAAEREKRYALDENAGCYMYYFKHKNQQYCIDATIDTGKLGRLVNHSRTGNLVTKVVVVKQCPHLVLLAKDDIEPGEELTYDYGDRSKESLLHHPWLAF